MRHATHLPRTVEHSFPGSKSLYKRLAFPPSTLAPTASAPVAVLTTEPPEAAAHRVADDADVGGGAQQARQAVNLGLVDQVGPDSGRSLTFESRRCIPQMS